ncbi:MAG: hypothetical protein KAX19_11060, partial [Candidatus Brocadiae bacterium]|nr:hypothetical protein [Candidatus Brocadiia bacterium]
QEPLLTPEERNPATRKLLRGGLSEVPLLMKRSTQRTAVELANAQRRELSGEACLKLPHAVTLAGGERESHFRVAKLTEAKPWRRPISLKAAADGPTAGVGELRLSTQRRDYVFPVPVVIVKTGRRRLSLRRSDGCVTVDTGWLRFKVSAEHGGSIVSLERRGRELVRSSYPTPRPYHWMNPWYGGVLARAGSRWDRRLHVVRRSIEPVSVVGATGIRWEGAQVTCTPTHQDWRWLRYKVQYLSTAGSNLLAVVLTAANRTSARMGVYIGVAFWPADVTGQAYVERDGKPMVYNADRYEYTVRAGNWLAFAVGRGAVLGAVAPRRDPSWRLGLENLGDGLFSASVGRRADLNPKVGSVTEVAWLVGCRSVEEAHAYRFLSELAELP